MQKSQTLICHLFIVIWVNWPFTVPLDSVGIWLLLCVHVLSDSSVWVPQAEIDAAVQLLLKLKVDYKQATGQDYKAGCPPAENSVAPDNGPAADGADDGDTVDPWNVSTTNAKGVDYDKLIGKHTYSKLTFLVFDSVKI